MGASALKESHRLPAYSPPRSGFECDASTISRIHDDFKDARPFCDFFLSWSDLASTNAVISQYSTTPVQGRTVQEVSKACTCIIKDMKPTPFCSSPIPMSLQARTEAQPFCRSVLGCSRVTHTHYATVTPVNYQTVTVQITVSSDTTIIIPSATMTVSETTSVLTFCGAGRQKFKRREAEMVAFVSTPRCLSGKSAEYITSACDCLALSTPTTSIVVTRTAAPSMVSMESISPLKMSANM
ncbi:hypothetical protein ANO11243_067020 [Dothideomycetidae sp. 11243]|nr:hypothetical protein ANO11243_067020 [fungal sp. No.11243]